MIASFAWLGYFYSKSITIPNVALLFKNMASFNFCNEGKNSINSRKN